MIPNCHRNFLRAEFGAEAIPYNTSWLALDPAGQTPFLQQGYGRLKPQQLNEVPRLQV